MRKLLLSCVTVVTIFFVLFVSCKLVEGTGDTVNGVNALRLQSGDISGWTEIADEGFKDFEAANMYDRVNGEAVLYNSKGLVEGFLQNLSNSSKTAVLLVQDMGTPAHAKDIYDYWDAKNEDKSAASPFDLSVAEIDNAISLTGVSAYAHFDKYFLKFDFSGYSDKSEAGAAAASFVEVFEAKIAELN
jgi:hypothetical protein